MVGSCDWPPTKMRMFSLFCFSPCDPFANRPVEATAPSAAVLVAVIPVVAVLNAEERLLPCLNSWNVLPNTESPPPTLPIP